MLKGKEKVQLDLYLDGQLKDVCPFLHNSFSKLRKFTKDKTNQADLKKRPRKLAQIPGQMEATNPVEGALMVRSIWSSQS